MKFYYEGAELGKIIKKYEKEDCAYKIYYMDGSISVYVSYNKDEEKKIKLLMIEQAKTRADLYDKSQIHSIPNINLVGSIVSLVGLGVSETTDSILLKIISLLFLGLNLSSISLNTKKIKELEKYKLFLELLENVGEKELNSSKYTKTYEFDNMYAKELSINTVDEFSLSDIKRMHKVYCLCKK